MFGSGILNAQNTTPLYDSSWTDPATGYTYYVLHGKQVAYGFQGVNGWEIHSMGQKKDPLETMSTSPMTLESLLIDTSSNRSIALRNHNYEETIKYNKLEIDLLKQLVKVSDSEKSRHYSANLADSYSVLFIVYNLAGKENNTINEFQQIADFEKDVFSFYPTGIIDIYSKIADAYYSLAMKQPKGSDEQKQLFMDCAKYGYEVPSEKFGDKWLGSMTKEQDPYLNNIVIAYEKVNNIKSRIPIVERMMQLFPNSKSLREYYNKIVNK